MKVFSFNKIKPSSGSFIEVIGGLLIKNVKSDNSLQVVNKGYVDARFIPIGVPFFFDKEHPSVPALPDACVYLDGQLITDPDSSFYGYRVRNLNGANVVLTQTWTADVDGAYTTVSDADLPGIDIGHSVSGSGIAANTTITEITGNTVVISDVSATGEIVSTFTNPGIFIRGGTSSGTGQLDAMEEHYHLSGLGDTNDGGYNSSRYGFQVDPDNTTTKRMDGTGALATLFDEGGKTSQPKNTSSEDNARTDSETRPINTTMVYAMRIK